MIILMLVDIIVGRSGCRIDFSFFPDKDVSISVLFDMRLSNWVPYINRYRQAAACP